MAADLTNNGSLFVNKVFPRSKSTRISMLGEDLLWLIFMKNTEHPSPFIKDQNNCDIDNLTTTRRASQVCRQWRELTLRSSSLWGRLIDLNYLNQNSDFWRNEVLSRTKQSPLWIVGFIDHKNKSFFFSLLDLCWTRIQRLDIYDFYNFFGANVDGWCETFNRPSPSLKIFRVKVYRVSFRREKTSPIALFCNSAPVLKEFVAPQIKFDPNSPWLTNIRVIDFPISFTIPEIFDALNTMYLLEHLMVNCDGNSMVAQNIYVGPRLVELPRLRKLWLTGHISNVLLVLEYIHPPPGCQLNIKATNSSEAEAEFKSTFQKVGWYLQNCFLSFRTPSHISFAIGMDRSAHLNHQKVTFSVSDKEDTSDEPSFYIHISGGNFESSISALLSELSNSQCSCLSNTQRLDLNFVEPNPEWGSSIISMLATLHSVTDLRTRNDSLEFILEHFSSWQCSFQATSQENLSLCPAILFPALDSLKLDSIKPSGSIFRFLKAYRDAGHPISVLDLRNVGPRQMYDMGFLEELTGLKVLWG